MDPVIHKAELVKEARELKARVAELRSPLEIDRAKFQLAELEPKVQAADFWNDRERAQTTLRTQDRLRKAVNQFESAERDALEIDEFLEIAGDDDQALLGEIKTKTLSLVEQVKKLEMAAMFSEEADPNNAIVSINSGAGGTESQDWVAILLRMFTRWAERRGFKTQLVDQLEGEGAGFKNVTFTVSGDFAYGYLKAEGGIHRLVRISPFDANSRRHTSFASVFVIPEVSEDIDIKIEDKDLRIDTYRAGGAGGQHVNKTDSAVRITHLPTNIVVQCQNERSQHKNKAVAMTLLKSKLYERELEERKKAMDKYHATKKEIGWGSQIRSYVLQPYQLIKDHRTKFESGNVNAVLDGDLTAFMEAYLMYSKNPDAYLQARGATVKDNSNDKDNDDVD